MSLNLNKAYFKITSKKTDNFESSFKKDSQIEENKKEVNKAEIYIEKMKEFPQFGNNSFFYIFLN